MASKLPKTISRYLSLKVLAIIPARGGSKGIPKKNIVNFKGKPLIQWTINAAFESKYITDICVSSDDDEILNSVKEFKNLILIKRPKELAQDNSRTEPVLLHALETIPKKFDYLILLQPTSPLRNSNHINEAFKNLFSKKVDALISVCSLEHHPFKTFKVDTNGFLKGIINNDFPFFPRQKLPKTFRANGAIYIVKVDKFKENLKLLTNTTAYYKMSKLNSLDIDSIEDLQ